MGFSKPKAIKPTAAPPPVSTSGAEVNRAKEDAQRDLADNQGYQWTMEPTEQRKSLLSKPNSVRTPKPQAQPKSLLSLS